MTSVTHTQKMADDYQTRLAFQYIQWKIQYVVSFNPNCNNVVFSNKELVLKPSFGDEYNVRQFKGGWMIVLNEDDYESESESVSESKTATVTEQDYECDCSNCEPKSKSSTSSTPTSKSSLSQQQWAKMCQGDNVDTKNKTSKTEHNTNRLYEQTFVKLCQSIEAKKVQEAPKNDKQRKRSKFFQEPDKKWNAELNEPELASGKGEMGESYIVSVSGDTELDGINEWKVGEWLLFNDENEWEKIKWVDVGKEAKRPPTIATLRQRGKPLPLPLPFKDDFITP
jgi:hypothetical protein